MIKVPQVTYSSVPPRSFEGSNVEVTLLDPIIVQEIFSLENEQPINHIRPSSEDTQLVTIRARVLNSSGTTVKMDIAETPPQLEAEDGRIYKALDIPNLEAFYYYEEAGQQKNIPLIRGAYDLEEETLLDGRLVFDIPKASKMTSFRWQAGDDIAIDFQGNLLQGMLEPSSEDNELVLVHARVGNHAATKVQLDIDSEPAELRTADGGKYLALSLPDPDAFYQYENAGQRTNIPIIRGIQELEKDFEVNGWLVFDLPTTADIDRFRWAAGGDVIIITF